VHKVFLLATVLLLTACSSIKVIGITDGDTLTIIQSQIPIKVRISAIDAPEKKQPFGEQAKHELSDLCFKKSVKLIYVDTDRYGRTVADVYCDGFNAGEAMVARSYVWAYEKYIGEKGYYRELQAKAKSEGVGLWVDKEPIPPWDWRKR
jgi:endonuclease YncB( thermonuclease family)